MKKYTRKIALALVLVMMMLMSLATVPAFAEGEATVTIYFQNNWLWTDVCCHYWGTDSGETSWPGNAMNLVEVQGVYEIYSINVPANVEGVIFNGIKDDGSGNRDQTPNIETGITDGAGWCMVWDEANSANAVAPFAYQGTGSGAGTDSTPVEPKDTLIYIKNDANWESVYFYCWNLDGGTMEQWPGEPMTAVGDGYYVAFLAGNLNYTHMKFNDGNVDGQTQESPELRIPYEGNNLYNNSTKSWSEAPDLNLDNVPVPDGYEKPDTQTPDDGQPQQPQKQGFFAKMWQGIVNFFKSIGTFFVNLFGGKKK